MEMEKIHVLVNNLSIFSTILSKILSLFLHNSCNVYIVNYNQSVENAGVAFVKGANEINEFFEKINKQ